MFGPEKKIIFLLEYKTSFDSLTINQLQHSQYSELKKNYQSVPYCICGATSIDFVVRTKIDFNSFVLQHQCCMYKKKLFLRQVHPNRLQKTIR